MQSSGRRTLVGVFVAVSLSFIYIGRICTGMDNYRSNMGTLQRLDSVSTEASSRTEPSASSDIRSLHYSHQSP